MSFERPSPRELTYVCDACPDVIEFNKDESDPVDDSAACWERAVEIGWFRDKPPNRSWQHFCPDCAAAAKEIAESRQFREQERRRQRARNA